MKMVGLKKSKVLVGLMVIITIGMASCSKEEIRGCMDPSSINYNSKAEIDDGTCKYEGTGVLYFDKDGSDIAISQEVEKIEYYIAGALVGSASPNDYVIGEPNCGDNKTVTFTRVMSQKTETVSLINRFTFPDGTHIDFDSYPITIRANNCTKILASE